MALERNMTFLRRMNEILDLNTLTLMIIINNKESPSSTGCSSKPSLFEVENHVSAVSAGAAIWIVAYERRFVLGLDGRRGQTPPGGVLPNMGYIGMCGPKG